MSAAAGAGTKLTQAGSPDWIIRSTSAGLTWSWEASNSEIDTMRPFSSR